MNSYPPELLAQLAPVMFVAGLDVTQPAATDSADQSKPPDAFQVLSTRLREALMNQRKAGIWQPEKSKTFQVVLVDKDARFPPRKLVPPEDHQYSASHSPLSPLTPSSPLHPDGLIAPIWIRKHTALVPSVFVMFLRIFEFPPHVLRTPLDGHEPEKDRAEEERKRDTELSAEISQRKKGTNERGVKLTIVLMASRRLLDDPTLDSRLTFIRRQSGLDSRAALFVLSPVSASELSDFVKSLQQALYEPALEYYTAHSKRVRRKRNRHSQVTASYPNPAAALANPNIARPLRPEGWTVRYEYKMACFAEFRGEDEVALKHYQDAYSTLVLMFGSTAILPPRTKRWAEAKVLADCINVKIVKLYLYNNEHALALSHHNTHIRQFSDFSRGWGIGEETFEFWSWIARQYRILAELIDYGTRSGLVIPLHKPAVSSTNSTLSRLTVGVPEMDVARTLGINPSHLLQHSGYYYYLAAKCTELRRARFLAAVEAELNRKPIALSPGFTNEKKVDHLALILELYTKAYDLFKRNTPSTQDQVPSRLTLLIAYRIAETHYEAGKYDMAVRFFERIAKTYRREGWYAMLRPLLSTWYSCAQQMGNVELSIKLLIEMMGHDADDSDEQNSLEEDLLAVFQSTVPSSSNEPLLVELADAPPIFKSSTVFWDTEVKVGEAAAFQLFLTAPERIVISSIPFASLEIQFSHVTAPLIIRHQPLESQTKPPVRRIHLGNINAGDEPLEMTADLRWQPGNAIVFTGSLTSDEPSKLSIESLILNIKDNTWNVKLPLSPCAGGLASPRWLRSLDPAQFLPVKRQNYSSSIVKHRPHLLHISFNHQGPAYLNEDYSIVIEVTNVDTRAFDVVADILLQPTDIDYAINSIYLDDQTSSGLIKDIHFGLLEPGVRASKVLHLLNTGAGGDRLLDISITSSTETQHEEIGAEEEEPSSPTNLDKSAHHQSLVIPTVAPFNWENEVIYSRSCKEWPGLADLETFDGDYCDEGKGSEALINLTVACPGPWCVFVESITLEGEDLPQARIVDCSVNLPDGNLFPSEYLPGDELSLFCQTSLICPDTPRSNDDSIPSPGRYVITWRRILQDGTYGTSSTTVIPLPPLEFPSNDLVALLDVAPKATLHTALPLTLIIRNYHPTRSANITVQLDPDTTEAFVLAGLRSGRVPVLLPGAEERIVWTLIPVDCGYVKLPRIKVIDRRRAIPGSSDADVANPEGLIGDPVKVVDLRRDKRYRTPGSDDNLQEFVDSGTEFGSILVLPPSN